MLGVGSKQQLIVAAQSKDSSQKMNGGSLFEEAQQDVDAVFEEPQQGSLADMSMEEDVCVVLDERQIPALPAETKEEEKKE
eukprot:CAMPEP_0180806492 /NCGR_PEP_ID=MMETSP1038_2-20121128/62631_1 /TAXON_ID=632150 /ORGANISM="Azadinium spinosum, Strain 3D9" /LENGTH=80 /DNA_ID=CAMNT_0022847221 /DNA_START=117 /DNA_END=356 /DNA_ORIENTATION=-